MGFRAVLLAGDWAIYDNSGRGAIVLQCATHCAASATPMQTYDRISSREFNSEVPQVSFMSARFGTRETVTDVPAAGAFAVLQTRLALRIRMEERPGRGFGTALGRHFDQHRVGLFDRGGELLHAEIRRGAGLSANQVEPDPLMWTPRSAGGLMPDALLPFGLSLNVVDHRLDAVLIHQRFESSLHGLPFLEFVDFGFHLPHFVSEAAGLAHRDAQGFGQRRLVFAHVAFQRQA